MKVLGITAGHDATAAVAVDGVIVAVIEEERLTGIKKQFGIPARAILHLCSMLGMGLQDFDKVAIGDAGGTYSKAHYLFPNAIRVPHHMAHAALAWAWSGWDECIIMTADGGGEELGSAIYEAKDGGLGLVYGNLLTTDSAPGQLYYNVTDLLGFTPNKHEGKVMGLAARGQNRFLFHDLYTIEGPRIRSHGDIRAASHRATGMPREDVAASVQAAHTDMMVEWIRQNAKGRKLAVAGGCFANVLTNMALAKEVEDLFVCPSMADAGLAAGAALAVSDEVMVGTPLDLYLGVGETVEYGHAREPSTVAQWIARGMVVGLYLGRMEHGPRALGARTIIADPRDAAIVDKLNRRLERSDFMPMAPVILEEYASEMIEELNAPKCAPFMTICYKAKPEWARKVPAVVHIDGTMRPQILKREVNPYYYDIVDEFRKLTGVPCLINTSFNVHESPIIAWVSQAMTAMGQNRIDNVIINGLEPWARQPDGTIRMIEKWPEMI